MMRALLVLVATVVAVGAHAAPLKFVYPANWSERKIARFEVSQPKVEAKAEALLQRILDKYAVEEEDGWYTMQPKYFKKFNYVTWRYKAYAPFDNLDVQYSLDGEQYLSAMGLRLGKQIQPTYMRVQGKDIGPVGVVPLGTPIPEPLTLGLLTAGVSALLLRRRLSA